MTSPLDPLSVVRIDIPRTHQGEGLAPQNSIWHRIINMQTSQKGLLIALGVSSICTVSIAIAEFFEPDPPPNSLMPSFVDTTVVAKNTQKWSLGIISLATATAAILYAKYFLKNQQQAEITITPEMASIIESLVKEEMINATPGPAACKHELT